MNRVEERVQRASALLSAIAGFSGFIGVAMGALGSHALKARLSPDLMAVFETGVKYQIWHTLALLVIATLCSRWSESRLLGWSALAMILGIVLFSGSLYALALTECRWFGAVTPFGGMSFLAGWLLLTLHFVALLRGKI